MPLRKVTKINNFEADGPLIQKPDSSMPSNGTMWFDRATGFPPETLSLLLRGVNIDSLREHVNERIRKSNAIVGEKTSILIYRIKRAIIFGIAELHNNGHSIESIEAQLLSFSEPTKGFDKVEVSIFNEIGKLNQYMESRGIAPFFNNDYLKKLKTSAFDFIRVNGLESMKKDFRRMEPDEVEGSTTKEDVVGYIIQDAIAFISKGGEIFAVSGSGDEIDSELNNPKARSNILRLSCAEARGRVTASKLPHDAKKVYSNFIGLIEQKGGISKACEAMGIRGYGE